MATLAPKVNGRPRARVEALAQPEQTGLAAALLAFHAQAPKLLRDSQGQIGSRTYGYVSLDGLLDVVEPLLLAHDLLWGAKVTVQDGQPAALYRMEHVPTGEADEWIGPLPCVDPGPQSLGSAITYMRRYTLVAYLNLAPGEDDDGLAASAQNGSTVPVDRYAQAAAAHAELDSRPPQPVATPAKPSERPLNDAQRKMLETRARAAGLSAVALANVILVAKGEQPRATDDQDAATRWLARELDRLPASLVTAVKEGIDQAGARS